MQVHKRTLQHPDTSRGHADASQVRPRAAARLASVLALALALALPSASPALATPDRDSAQAVSENADDPGSTASKEQTAESGESASPDDEDAAGKADGESGASGADEPGGAGSEETGAAAEARSTAEPAPMAYGSAFATCEAADSSTLRNVALSSYYGPGGNKPHLYTYTGSRAAGTARQVVPSGLYAATVMDTSTSGPSYSYAPVARVDTAGTDPGALFSTASGTGNNTSTPTIASIAGATTGATATNTWTGSPKTMAELGSMAIDGGGGGLRPGRSYLWSSYGNGDINVSGLVDSSGNGVSRPGSGSSSNQGVAVFSNTSTSGKPDATLFVPVPSAAGDSTANYWDGGAVDQKTGYIYFSHTKALYQNGTDTSGYRIMVFDPQTGKYTTSGTIRPKTATDATRVGGQPPTSDLAIDASGNAYTIVRSTSVMLGSNIDPFYTSLGVNKPTSWIVKFEQTGSGWVYSAVKPLQGTYKVGSYSYPAVIDGANGLSDGNDGGGSLGLAFSGGYLYASGLRYTTSGTITYPSITGTAQTRTVLARYLWRIDPTTGVAELLNGKANNGGDTSLTSGLYAGGITDLASDGGFGCNYANTAVDVWVAGVPGQYAIDSFTNVQFPSGATTTVPQAGGLTLLADGTVPNRASSVSFRLSNLPAGAEVTNVSLFGPDLGFIGAGTWESGSRLVTVPSAVVGAYSRISVYIITAPAAAKPQITGAKTVAPVEYGTLGELSAKNWELTITDPGGTAQVLSDIGIELTPGTKYTVSERTKPNALLEAKFYARKGDISCVDANNQPLSSSVFNSADGTLTPQAGTGQIACTITNQSAQVSLYTANIRNTSGLKLGFDHTDNAYDLDLTGQTTASFEHPGSYTLRASVPSDFAFLEIQQLNLATCANYASAPTLAPTNCWVAVSDSQVKSGFTIAQGKHYVFRISGSYDLPIIPVTGGLGTYLFVITGSGILIAALALHLTRRRRTLRYAA